MHPRAAPRTCPRCATPTGWKEEPHEAGTTVTCINCGHSLEYDPSGRPYTPDLDQIPKPAYVPHDTTSYPMMLACSTITLHKHRHAVRLNNAYVTDAAPIPVTMRVYHQPFRSPVLTFRPTRAKPQPGVSYIYAVEMDPYEEDIFTRMTRQPKDVRLLIQRVATEQTGLDMRTGSTPWHICPPGTMLSTPLAPAP